MSRDNIILSDYQQVKKDLKLNDNEMDRHETDLYIKHTSERIQYFRDKGFHPEIFRSEIDDNTWMDIPFYLLDDKINKR